MKKNGKKKQWWLLVVPVVLVIGLFVWWYIATNDIRQYKVRSYEMKLISERQELDLKIYHQQVELQRIMAAQQRPAVPVEPGE